ncbi:MAG: VirB4 family type IV secretion/conjugal transfer ATPase [Alphaproteobacteria bacterium]|nr:VirB4 family type IV secretion/conjugal transfer ATPase [Alphaproteobacteria bacterium]
MALNFQKRRTKKASYSKLEVAASSFMPYEYHWDNETIVTKKKEFLQTIKLDGFSFETADDEDVDMKKMVRNSLLKSMADGTFAVWFHTIRRRQSAYPGGKQPPGFPSFVDKQWHEKHHSKDSYINEIYITVVRRADTKGAVKVHHYLKKASEISNKMAQAESMREAQKELAEAIQRLVSTFRDYGARRLTTYETEQGVFSEPMEFLAKICNCGFSQPMRYTPTNISAMLPIYRLYFGDRAVEVSGGPKKRFAGLVSIREYAPATAAGLLDGFLQLPFEFIIAQSFTFRNRSTNINQMQIKQRRMMAAEDAAVSQIAEISDALDMAMSGHVAFGPHHMTVMCFEESMPELEKVLSMALAELVNIGVNPVREKFVMEPAFWAQMPGNFEYIARGSDINTMNMAGFASLHNYPTGKIAGNHWGDAVTVFDTSSGTPYFFNFHNRDVGHTTIIGPTGAGKTVLLNFLIAQAQKFNCRVFFFDKDRGAEIFMRAINGKYTVIEPGEKCHFNPLQLPDTPENRTFLGEWLHTLVTSHDEPFTAEDMDRINEAVAGNYKLAKKDRILRNIAPFFGIEGPGTMAGRLKMWHTGGPYAGLFDNETDVIDFGIGNAFGFEMGEVLKERLSLEPTLLYLFHRINLALDGTPTIIVLDEAWALIDNKIFGGRIRDWLKTLRKLNGMVVFATQSVEDATNSSISETLIQQTATQIFLPNPKATDAYRQAFMVTEREFNLLKTTDPGSRFFLVKQGKDVVVARIDLSGMDEVVNILSARAETVSILDQVRAEVGNAPEAWMSIFQERVKLEREKFAAKDTKK